MCLGPFLCGLKIYCIVYKLLTGNKGDKEVGEDKKHIVSDPSIMMGKPIIAGTRITVELVLEKLTAGETMDQILEAYPRLSRDAIHEALLL